DPSAGAELSFDLLTDDGIQLPAACGRDGAAGRPPARRHRFDRIHGFLETDAIALSIEPDGVDLAPRAQLGVDGPAEVGVGSEGRGRGGKSTGRLLAGCHRVDGVLRNLQTGAVALAVKLDRLNPAPRGDQLENVVVLR